MSLPSPIPPPPSSFTPRKEFLRDQQGVRNSFALLAISGPNCVRLYSFTPQTVQTVRRLLEQYAPITSVREDAVQNLCEFALDRKPWSNPKSVPSEKLLLDIIAAVYQSGYTFLSSIDYGREADDRLALAFSKPDAAATPPSRSASPLPAPSLHARNDSSNSTLSGGRSPAKRVPFAISFSSVTVMRVIAPPLHLTPAILQACRGSWPRGVVSEKKVFHNSYEFKLKGYGLFQQDTFATDSLHHILSLLASLDTHSFSLLTSVSLTPNHSRVKDLWIFTGPATDDSTTELNSSLLEVNPMTRLSMRQSTDTHASHKRQATEPAVPVPHSPVTTGHGRSASESPHRSPALSGHSNTLRKAAPRAQVPVSVRGSEILDDAEAPLAGRAYLPSVVASDVENMTGIGAGHSPAIFYETSPLDVAGAQAAQAAQHSRTHLPPPPPPAPMPHASPIINHQPTPVYQSTAPKVAPEIAKTSTPPVPSTPSPPASPAGSRSGTPVAELNPNTPLLGSSAFRDSAFSSATEFSREIPIKWTGPLADDIVQERLEATKPKPGRLSSSPMLPGGWQATPVTEKTEEELDKSSKGTPIHENDKRIEAPVIHQPEFDTRRSEAALIGMIKSTSPTPPLATPKEGAAGGGTGWVLVNVDTPKASMTGDKQPLPAGHPSESSTGSSNLAIAATLPQQPTPEAKAIAIVDALEAKNKKSGAKKDESGVKRFFSINRKNSRRTLSDEEDDEAGGDDPSIPHYDLAPSTIQRSTLRDRIRRIGMPEAPRREDRRRSID